MTTPVRELVQGNAVAHPNGQQVERTPSGDPITPAVLVTPTQVRRPWRSTARTIFQALVALATLLPFVLAGVYSSAADYPAVVVQLLAAAGVVTRVMALPQVEQFLRTFLPFLAAAPDPAKSTDERGVFDIWLMLAIAGGIVTAWIVIRLIQHLLVKG